MASDEGAEGVIRRVLQALDVAGVPYMLTGSFASAFHGAPRTTQDVDIVIAPTLGSLQKLVRQFPEDEYYVSREAALQAYGAESLFNVIDLSSGWKIDFIVRKSRPFSLEEFERRREADLLGMTLFIASAEDVILSKLEWAKMSGSERQILQDLCGQCKLLNLREAFIRNSVRAPTSKLEGVDSAIRGANGIELNEVLDREERVGSVLDSLGDNAEFGARGEKPAPLTAELDSNRGEFAVHVCSDQFIDQLRGWILHLDLWGQVRGPAILAIRRAPRPGVTRGSNPYLARVALSQRRSNPAPRRATGRRLELNIKNRSPPLPQRRSNSSGLMVPPSNVGVKPRPSKGQHSRTGGQTPEIEPTPFR